MDEGAQTANSQRLAEMTRGINFVMLTTETADGSLRSRPMAAPAFAPDGRLWFFTRAGSQKLEEIHDYPEVNITFADPYGQRYVSVSGIARVMDDPGKIKELWQPAYEAWFPLGLHDPDLVLLNIEIEHAENFDAASGRMAPLIGQRQLTGNITV